MRKLFAIVLISGMLFAGWPTGSTSADTRPEPEDRGPAGLLFALRRLQTIASVLHTAAHPDDESTELLAYLARGQGDRGAGAGPEVDQAGEVLETALGGLAG